MRILIVDDSSVMRKIVHNSLKNIGYGCGQILDASDGEQALRLIHSEHLDLVFLDWNMPCLNGLELVKLVRQEPQFATLPLIMITSVSAKHNIIQAVKAGVNDYLIKPFSEEKLAEILLRTESRHLLTTI